MPRSAIQTNAVDLVLPVERIPASLLPHRDRSCAQSATTDVPAEGAAGYGEPAWLAEVIQLLRTRTAYDFTLYKHGTLRRRVERRRAMAGIDPGDMDRYLAMLRHDAGELDLLAKDLLINVTRFFRDPEVFDFLAERIVPGLIGHASPGRAIRVWVAACSTGEETYSLAMLLREKMASAACNIELQVFASDIDADAVASAREGLYPATIEADVSPARLARFFSREERGYRVLPELRASIVFTVHDVLVNPPFSQLDLVSCRNLLIYLNPAAQAKVVSQFRFRVARRGRTSHRQCRDASGRGRPLRDHLEAGTGLPPYRPQPLATRGSFREPWRRHAFAAAIRAAAGASAPVERRRRGAQPLARHLRAGRRAGQPESRMPVLLRLDRPVSACASGPADSRRARPCAKGTADQTSFRDPAGDPDERAGGGAGGTVNEAGHAVPFDLDVQPVSSDGEDLLLICFVAAPRGGEQHPASIAPRDLPRVAALEHELEATETELEDAIRSLEISGEDQKAINEEALSINEEYQSTNEELLTSKEELQSLNEELTALNGQLQETLERQRTTSNDLQNVLYSTNVATLFLDTHLNIRFFTPATRLYFSVIPGDIGRPLADLSSLASDGNLLADARTVLQTSALVEREIEAAERHLVHSPHPALSHRRQRAWRVSSSRLPTSPNASSPRRRWKPRSSSRPGEYGEVALSRCREPRPAPAAPDTCIAAGGARQDGRRRRRQSLIARLDQTLGAMSGMLNTLLDINQIESGTVRAERVRFPIADLLDRMRDEFSYHAEAHGLGLRVAPCGLAVQSDPRLLAQVIRNLLSNALKYTRRGKVLLGCRRRAHMLRIEIWDTGIGIPGEDLRRSSTNIISLITRLANAAEGWGWGCRSRNGLPNSGAAVSACARIRARVRCSQSRSRLRRTEAHAVAAADRSRRPADARTTRVAPAQFW